MRNRQNGRVEIRPPTELEVLTADLKRLAVEAGELDDAIELRLKKAAKSLGVESLDSPLSTEERAKLARFHAEHMTDLGQRRRKSIADRDKVLDQIAQERTRLRDDLLERIKMGTLDRADGERDADRLDLDPLIVREVDTSLDPTRPPKEWRGNVSECNDRNETWWRQMDATKWTLGMAVAWIAFRYPRAVGRMWPAARVQAWMPEGDGVVPRDLPATIDQIVEPEVVVVGRGHRQVHSVGQALGKLRKALEAGWLLARGTDDNGRDQPILKDEWPSLLLLAGAEMDGVAAYGETRPRFRLVHVDRDEVLAIWKRDRTEATSKPRVSLVPEEAGDASSIVIGGTAADASAGDGAQKQDSPSMPAQAKKRRPKPLNPPQKTILAYIDTVHGGARPDWSDQAIAVAVIGWATETPEKQKKYHLGDNMEKKLVHDFFAGNWWMRYRAT